MSKIAFYIIFTLCMLTGCVKDKPNPDLKNLPAEISNGLLVLNEGSYGNNNAELSYISFNTKLTTQQLYKSVNGKSLGDVAQSITLINGRYYIAVNNSHKIAVIDTAHFSLLYTIDQIPFPRYLLQVSDDIAYVSSLYAAAVFVLQLSTHTVIDTIQTDFANTENMLLDGQYVYICNWDTACNYVYKVDKTTHVIQDRVMVGGQAAHDLAMDKRGKLWVLSGNKYKSKRSYLTCIDPANNAIIKTFQFAAEDDPIRLTLNEKKDTLYYINVSYNGQSTANGLYRMSVDALSLPVMPFIPAPLNTYFWAMAIDPYTNHVFLSDPKGFTQSSTIYEYSYEGEKLNFYQTGIGSNQFMFR